MKWLKKGLIFAPDRRFDWSVSHAQIPVVDAVDDRVLRIYFSTRDAQGRSHPAFIEVAAEDPRKLLYVHKEPLLPLGQPGTFDDSGIMPFCIVNRERQKQMYYVGWSTSGTVPYHQSIGLALSEDGGRSYLKYSEGPICDRSIEEPYFNTAPFVLVSENTMKMWYVSCTEWKLINGRLEPFYLVKYAESEGGIRWHRTRVVCIGYDDFTQAIGRPFVMIENNIYKMFYSFRNAKDYRSDPTQSYRLGYAESGDGIKWTRKDDEIGIARSDDGWDSEMMAYCYVHKHESRKYMFYNGNGFGRTGFGYAVLEED